MTDKKFMWFSVAGSLLVWAFAFYATSFLGPPPGIIGVLQRASLSNLAVVLFNLIGMIVNLSR